MMNLEDYNEKLKLLKKSVQDIKIRNRNLLKQEAEEKEKGLKPRVYSMHDDEDDSDEKRSSDEQSDMRTNLFQYTVQDFIDWEKRQQRKKKNKLESKSGMRLQHLAKNTYDKELQNLPRPEFKMKAKETQFRINKDSGKVDIKDNKELVQRLSQNLKETAKQRYDSNRKIANDKEHTSLSGSINAKNLQFNKSLDDDHEAEK